MVPIRKYKELTFVVAVGFSVVLFLSFLSHDSPPPPVKTILLVTYARSGSTFTSYILQQAPDTFYFFEPLRPLLLRMTAGMDIILNYAAIGTDYLKPQELSVANLSSYERRALAILESFMGCDISKYPVGDYSSVHFVHGNAAPLKTCLRPMSHGVSKDSLAHYLQCLLVFFQSCHQARLRLFKLVRMPIRSLYPILKRHPDLRVVYLVRDPRAILFSQRSNFGHAPNPKDFCNMVIDDVMHMKLLQQQFPGRAIAVRYEDIIRNPLTTAQRLYKALGLEMTSYVVTRVLNMTSAPKKMEGIYTVFRASPVQAAEKWRGVVEASEVSGSDAVCGKAYERLLGYRTASENSVLRNRNISLVGPPGELSVV